MHRFFKGFTLSSPKGFTLIELLIVVGILAVLATTVVLVLNPTEFMKKSRDATRLSDLATVNKAISLYQTDGGNSYGSSTAIYVSIPDSSSSCANLGLPSLPAGYGYICSDTDNYQKADGDGWIPIDFTSVSYGTVLNTLPVDPTNTVATGQYYTYTPGGSWKLAALMESEKYSANMNSDGGPDLGLYELGSNLSLKPFQRGLVGYWKFDEGSGTTAYDSSGNGNNGTLYNSPTWTSGQINGALSFDGVDNYVDMGDPVSGVLDFGINNFTISSWIKTSSNVFSSITGKTSHVTDVGYSMDISLPSAGRIRIVLLDNSNYMAGTTNTANNGNWHHVVAIRSGDNLFVYIDGEQKAEDTGSNNIDVSSSVSYLVGARTGSNPAYFNGLIDDVRVYNRALSASEIKSIYDATK